jgi:hypothetical protein
MIDRVSRTLTAVFIAAGVVAIPSAVRAQQRVEGESRETKSTTQPTTTQQGTDVVSEEEYNNNEDELGRRRPKHEPLYLGLDVTLGFGNYNVAMELNPQPPNFQPTYGLDVVQVRTVDFTMMGHYHFKKFGIGVRLPLISGHISGDPSLGSEGAGSQDIFVPGNLELSLDMPRRLSKQVKYIPEIALTIPTSPGDATPYTDTVLQQRTCGATTSPSSGGGQCNVSFGDAATLGDAYARNAIGFAAAMARGGEDDALFFNWRLGVTPKVGFDLTFNHTHIQPYLKVPIMFGLEQNSAAEEPVRIEAVAGVRFLQEIGPLHLGARFVGMIPIAARTTVKTPMLSVWPEVRVQVTPSAQFWLSGMIPLAGDFNVFDNSCNSAPQGCAKSTSDGKNGAFVAGISATF